MKEMDKGMNN